MAEKRLEMAFAQELRQSMGGDGGPPQKGGGRPQTFQEMPKRVQKSDGSITDRTSR